MKNKIIDKLYDINACPGAIKWARTQPNPHTAWAKCRRGDWMIWILAAMDNGDCESARLRGQARRLLRERPPQSTQRQLALALCECLELAHPCLDSKSRGQDQEWIALIRQWAFDIDDNYLNTLHREADDHDWTLATSQTVRLVRWLENLDSDTADRIVYNTAYLITEYRRRRRRATKEPKELKELDPILAQCADIVRFYFPRPPVLVRQ